MNLASAAMELLAKQRLRRYNDINSIANLDRQRYLIVMVTSSLVKVCCFVSFVLFAPAGSVCG